jgi:hypothetical protein
MRLHVSVHVVGLNRALSFTAKTMVKRLIRPLSRLPWVQVDAQILLVEPEGPILNPRTGESGFVERGIPSDLKSIPIEFLSQARAAADSERMREALLAKGDKYGDEGKSLQNALVYARALRHSWQTRAEESDVVIVVRPDLAIAGRLWIGWRVTSLALKSRLGRPEIYVPAWGSFDGVNDRFAMMSGQIGENYLSRYDRLDDWLREGGPFNSEQFLAFVLEERTVRRNIYAPMYRIRLGARREEADVALFRRSATWRRTQDSLIHVARVLRALRKG